MAKLRSVEGTRGLAAFAVLSFHVGLSSGGWLHVVTARFWLGVPLFFVISGFLLFRPYAVATITQSQWPSLRRYVRARILRIVPAYWLVLTVTILVVDRGSSGWTGVLNYLLVFLPTGRLGLVPQAWTLCIEISFYLLLPTIAYAGAVFARRAASERDRAVRLALIVALGFPIASLYFEVVGNRLSFENTYPALLPAFIDEFAIGMLLAILVAQRVSISRAASRLMLGGAICIAVAANLKLKTILPYAEGEGWGFSRLMAIAFALALASVILRQERTLLGHLLSARVVVAAGTISYGAYLWHVLFISELRGTRFWWSPLTNLLMIAVLTTCAATVSWFLVEQPVLRLKSRPSGRFVGQWIGYAPPWLVPGAKGAPERSIAQHVELSGET